MFVKFKCLVENLFTFKIKQFQTDGGGEYLSNTFTNFLSTHRILHRVTCPHTSQQNEIAKRKHMHIIETTLTVLAQSHLPVRYWVEAVCTSTYLINTLPTPTLNNSNPFSKLFHKNPDYSLLRTFGCACYPLQNISLNLEASSAFSLVTVLTKKAISVLISPPTRSTSPDMLFFMKCCFQQRIGQLLPLQELISLN
jgi:hypothetical protein